MQSHQYQFNFRSLLKVIGPLVAMVIFLMAILFGASRLGLAPKPRQSVNPDSATLFHQMELSRRHTDTEVVLVGDSSCMMGADPAIMASSAPSIGKVVNLGLIVGLPLDVYGETALDQLTLNDHSVNTVVLLVSPSKLNVQLKHPHFEKVWAQLMELNST